MPSGDESQTPQRAAQAIKCHKVWCNFCFWNNSQVSGFKTPTAKEELHSKPQGQHGGINAARRIRSLKICQTLGIRWVEMSKHESTHRYFKFSKSSKAAFGIRLMRLLFKRLWGEKTKQNNSTHCQQMVTQWRHTSWVLSNNTFKELNKTEQKYFTASPGLEQVSRSHANHLKIMSYHIREMQQITPHRQSKIHWICSGGLWMLQQLFSTVVFPAVGHLSLYTIYTCSQTFTHTSGSAT